MKVRTLFLAVLLIAVGDASAQQISFLPIGRNIEKGISGAYFQLDSRDYKYRIATDDMRFAFDAGMGAFQDVLERHLRGLRLSPPHGGETAEYCINLITYGGGIVPRYGSIATGDETGWSQTTIESYGGYFLLEKRDDGLAIPKRNLRPRLYYGGPLLRLSAVTGVEVVARSGDTTYVLSTITGRNDFGVLCEVPSMRAALTDGIIQLPSEFTVTEAQGAWMPLEITLWENERFVYDELTLVNGTITRLLRGIHGPNDRFVVVDQDGLPLRQSATPPTSFQPSSPIALQKTVNGHLELTVSGEGVLEESVDFAEWHIPYALTVLSENPPRRFRVPQEGGMKFYRLRPAPAAAQTVQKR